MRIDVPAPRQEVVGEPFPCPRQPNNQNALADTHELGGRVHRVGKDVDEDERERNRRRKLSQDREQAFPLELGAQNEVAPP